jgi:hypothetical protein
MKMMRLQMKKKEGIIFISRVMVEQVLVVQMHILLTGLVMLDMLEMFM